MIKITKKAEEKKDEKRYDVGTVAHILGETDSAVSTYFSNRKRTTRGGVTLEKIVEFIEWRTDGHRRGNGIKWEQIPEIKQRLRDEYGICIEETE